MAVFQPTKLGLSARPICTLRLAEPQQTARLGALLARLLGDGGFVGLVGDLGAGKTSLVQGLVGELNPTAEASSPTYTLLNEYETEPPVWHFDLYRLESADDLETVGYWDYAEDDEAIVLVEWIDRILMAWQPRGALVWLTHEPGDTRAAAIWAPPELEPVWRERLMKLDDELS